jgi:hypothetical protein
MILLDTNVLIYASTDQSPFLEWARHTIAAGPVSATPTWSHSYSTAPVCPQAWISRSQDSRELQLARSCSIIFHPLAQT